jgi:hypothetical protein
MKEDRYVGMQVWQHLVGFCPDRVVFRRRCRYEHGAGVPLEVGRWDRSGRRGQRGGQ